MDFSLDLLRAWSKKATSRSFISHFIILFFSALLLVSCQTGRTAVSLDEAKQISLQFSDASFVPPPRSTNDIQNIIDDYIYGNEIPNCSSDRYRRSLNEISKSLDTAPPCPNPGCKENELRRMAKSEINNGNYSRCIQLQKMAITEIPMNRNAGRGVGFMELSKYYAYGGDFKSAKTALNTALSYYSQTNYSSSWTRYFKNEGFALINQLQGNYLIAEMYFRKAIEEIKGLSTTYLEESLKVDLSENLMYQGRLVEAEILAREMVTYFRRREGNYTEGKALLSLSRILFEQGRYIEAEYISKAAVNKYLSIGADCSSIFLNLARRTIAQALMAQERWKEAVEQFEVIREGMRNDAEAFDARFAGDVDWAVALLKSGHIHEAIRMLEAGLETTIKQFGKKHYRAAEIRGLLAVANAAEGNQEAAIEGFKAAMLILQVQSSQAEMKTLSGSTHSQRQTLIIENYLGLLADVLGTPLETKASTNPTAEAFFLANMARDLSVKHAIAASVARSAVKDPELSDLVRREQDAGLQINALYVTLSNALSQPSADQNPKMIQSLRGKTDKLNDARLSLVQEIESRFPKYINLINPKPLSLYDTKAALVPGESLVSIYIGQDRSYVWAVPYQGEVSFVSIPLGKKDVAKMVEKIRYALEPNAKTLGELPEFDLDTSYAIYKAFLYPVRKGWKDAKSLIVISHGALGYLPLSLLPTKPTKLTAEKKTLLQNYQKVPWLVRSHAVTILPSASSLKTLRSFPPRNLNQRAFIGFGDPYFSEQQARTASYPKEKVRIAVLENRSNYSLRGISIERIKTDELESAELAILPRLPETKDEIRSIALALNADLEKDVFTGLQANEQQVKAMDLSDYKVIAFATHGLAPGDLNGLLQPALALTSPRVSNTEGDGLLTMGEILGLRMNADWVVLSACNTGAGKEEGAEALSGLGRAFFYAGARALLVSNWPVETTSAKALTTNLFKIQAENPSMTRTEALRQSMLSLIDGEGYIDPASRKVVFSYAHPIFWAPFTLVGDGIGNTKDH